MNQFKFHRLYQGVTDLLVLLLPFSVFWPVREPVVQEVLPLYVTAGIYLSDLALGLIFLLTVFKWPFRTIGPRLFFYPLLGLVALAYLTAVTALAPGFAFYSAGRWLLALIVFLWLAQPHIEVPHTVRVFVAGMTVHVLVGIAQVWLQGPLGLPGELALPPAVSGAAIIPVGEMRWLRAYGLTFHPNVLGGFLAVAIIVTLPLLRRWVWKFVWGLLWLGLFLSFSRSAWIAAALGMAPVVVWMLIKKPAGRRHLLASLLGAGAVLAICAVIWWPQVSTRLQPLLQLVSGSPAGAEVAEVPALEARSLDERATFLRISLDLIAERPLTGVGAGSFPIAIRENEIAATPQFAHLVPLNLAAEVGVVGGVIWLGLWAAGGWYLIQQWRGDDPWAISLLSGWLAMGLISLFDSYPWSLNAGLLLTVTVLGLAANRVVRGESETQVS